MTESDLDKTALAISTQLAACVRQLHALHARHPRGFAHVCECTGVVLQLTQLETLLDQTLAELADLRADASAFARLIFAMSLDKDDWSTSHDKCRQLVEPDPATPAPAAPAIRLAATGSKR